MARSSYPAVTPAMLSLGNIAASAVSPYNGALWLPGIFHRLFGFGRQSEDEDSVPGQKISRRSTGFNEFIRAISREEGLKILDLGSTSPANITFMTGLGHRFQQEDRVAPGQRQVPAHSEW